MPERLTHTRTTTAPSTPAQRLLEVQREVVYLRARLTEEQAKNERYSIYTTLGSVSFGGIPAAQQFCDMVLWEILLNEHPRLKTIIELGTWKGGFSWWLWAQAQVRQMGFHTFDSVPPDAVVPNFQRRDVFAEAQPLGEWFRALQPLVLLCDNGNKPRELRTFAPFLDHPDSLIVAHDWGTEILPEDVPDKVEMVYADLCDEMGSISRVFRPRRTDGD